MKVYETMTKNDQSTLEKLNQIYDKYKTTSLLVNYKCAQCGIDVEIAIHRTKDGFGMNGGALYLNCEGQLMAKCLKCHKA